jgi:hypothetical protein
MEKTQTQHIDIKYIMERSCLNKKSYTLKQADRAIEYAYTQNRMFYYYKCQFCQSFHLTSKEPITVRQLEVV